MFASSRLWQRHRMLYVCTCLAIQWEIGVFLFRVYAYLLLPGPSALQPLIESIDRYTETSKIGILCAKGVLNHPRGRTRYVCHLSHLQFYLIWTLKNPHLIPNHCRAKMILFMIDGSLLYYCADSAEKCISAGS